MNGFLYNPDWIIFPTDGKIAINRSFKELRSSEPLYSCAAYGILCGPRSGVAVIDIDTKKGAELFRNDIIKRGYSYMEVVTRRGSHFYFNHRSLSNINKGNYKHDKYGPIDIMCNNDGYVIGPGSNVNDHIYWIKRFSVGLTDFYFATKLLKDELHEYTNPLYD